MFFYLKIIIYQSMSFFFMGQKWYILQYIAHTADP